MSKFTKFKLVTRGLYEGEHSVQFKELGGRSWGGAYRVWLKPNYLVLQILWGGVKCDNCDISFNMRENKSYAQQWRNFLASQHPYIALVLFDANSVELTKCFQQVHDNDAGPGEMNPLDEEEVNHWKNNLQQMSKATPAISWIVKLILRRANQILSKVQI